jgi:hypothetical protein
MDPHEMVQTLLVISVVVVPALGVTARFALKPIVDAILRLKESGLISGPGDAAAQQLAVQVQELRGEVAAMQRQLGELKEAADFHRSLQQPPAGGALPNPQSE